MTRRLAAHRATPTMTTSRRRRLRRIAAVLGAILVATTGIVVLTSPADAATRAYGFEGSTGWLGTVTAQDGTRSICVNPIGLFPSGVTTYAGLVSSIEAETAASNGGYGGTAYTSGAAIQELNYAEGVWVNTTSNVTAAALDLFAYSLVADYPGPVGSATNLNYYSQRAGSHAADVRAAEAAIAKQTVANFNKPSPATADNPVIEINNSTLKGTVTASVTPSSAPGRADAHRGKGERNWANGNQHHE